MGHKTCSSRSGKMSMRYEICRLKYVPWQKRFLELKDGLEENISAQEIELLYTQDALEMLGKWPNTWCVIMEEDDRHFEDENPSIFALDSDEDDLTWQNLLLPALILRGRAWTA
jgi:hypothetical protein